MGIIEAIWNKKQNKNKNWKSKAILYICIDVAFSEGKYK